NGPSVARPSASATADAFSGEQPLAVIRRPVTGAPASSTTWTRTTRPFEQTASGNFGSFVRRAQSCAIVPSAEVAYARKRLDVVSNAISPPSTTARAGTSRPSDV